MAPNGMIRPVAVAGRGRSDVGVSGQPAKLAKATVVSATIAFQKSELITPSCCMSFTEGPGHI